MGLRFRKDHPIRLSDGKVARLDIAFTKKKVAVFVDGCFWHSCPQHGTTPKSNQNYWLPKLKENVERDSRNNSMLEQDGWRVIRVWEHVEPAQAARCIFNVVAC